MVHTLKTSKEGQCSFVHPQTHTEGHTRATPQAEKERQRRNSQTHAHVQHARKTPEIKRQKQRPTSNRVSGAKCVRRVLSSAFDFAEWARVRVGFRHVSGSAHLRHVRYGAVCPVWSRMSGMEPYEPSPVRCNFRVYVPNTCPSTRLVLTAYGPSTRLVLTAYGPTTYLVMTAYGPTIWY
eukprot:822703-Rhodomonas_salina.2